MEMTLKFGDCTRVQGVGVGGECVLLILLPGGSHNIHRTQTPVGPKGERFYLPGSWKWISVCVSHGDK